MIKKIIPVLVLLFLIAFPSCNGTKEEKKSQKKTSFKRKSPNDRQVDRFADIQVLRYEIKDFDKLTLKQKKLVYYLSQAGLSGRDIIYDQNNKYNLEIRRCLESIVRKI